MEIKCESISKVIDGKTIIENLDLLIKNGEIFGLVGPNGAGKTTLIRLILNLYELTKGNIYIDDIDVNSKNFNKLKCDIGVLLDCLGLYKDLTAWENIEFFDRIYYPNSSKKSRKERIGQSLNDLGLYDRRNDKIIFFSKGMKQRLALARVFNAKPKLLFLDEPTTGLDVEGQFAIREAIIRLQKQGTTIFLNSHNLGELQKMCTHIGFLKNGILIEEGTLDEISNRYKASEKDLEELYMHIMGNMEGLHVQ